MKAPTEKRKRKRGGKQWKASTASEDTGDAIGPADTASRDWASLFAVYRDPSAAMKAFERGEDVTMEGYVDEWKYWGRQGRLVRDDLHLIVSKVPLGGAWTSIVSDEDMFTPKMLLRYHRSKKHPIGLIIHIVPHESPDLSDFYCPHEVYSASDLAFLERESVVYSRLMATCDTSSELFEAILPACPTAMETNSFVSLVDQFRQKYPEKYVLVHCSSGINLAGFFFVAYLVEAENIAVDAALRLFQQARNPGITFLPFIRELFMRYEGMTLVEVQHAVDGLGIVIQSQASLFPFWKEAVVLPEAKLQPIIKACCSIVQADTLLEFFSTAVQPLEKEAADTISDSKCMVTWNTQPYSTRVLLYITEHGCYILALGQGGSICVHQMEKLRFPSRRHPEKILHATLLVGDVVTDNVDGTQIHRIIVSDVISFEGQSLSKLDIAQRLQCASKEIIDPFKQRSDQLPQWNPSQIRLRPQKLFPFPQASTVQHTILPKLPHKHSGLVLIFRNVPPQEMAKTSRAWGSFVSQ